MNWCSFCYSSKKIAWSWIRYRNATTKIMVSSLLRNVESAGVGCSVRKITHGIKSNDKNKIANIYPIETFSWELILFISPYLCWLPLFSVITYVPFTASQTIDNCIEMVQWNVQKWWKKTRLPEDESIFPLCQRILHIKSTFKHIVIKVVCMAVPATCHIYFNVSCTF